MNRGFLLVPTVVSVFAIVFSCLAVFLGRSLLYIRERRRQIVCDGQSVSNDFEDTRFDNQQSGKMSLLVVLGSGGHTAEMLTLVNDVINSMKRDIDITYAHGSTDSHSKAKAVKISMVTEAPGLMRVTQVFKELPRAREVGQSWASSIWTSLKTSVSAAKLLWDVRPHVVLTNGPGTSAIVGAIAFGLRTLRPKRQACQIVYVESFARVESLSMSGRLMYLFADRFVVQWSRLQVQWPLSEYYGRLC